MFELKFKIKSLSRAKLLFFNASRLGLLILLVLSVAPIEEATAPEFLEGWNNRKVCTVAQVTGLGTLFDYQINFTVHYGAGTDSDQHIYLDGKCQADFDDLRITATDNTLWAAWAETDFYFTGDNATIWTKVEDDIGAGSIEFYLYYGNDAVSSYWNGTDTFLAWDDFDVGYNIGDPLNARWQISDEPDVGEKLEIASMAGIGRPNLGLMVREEAVDLPIRFYQSFDPYIEYENIAVHFHVRPDFTGLGQTYPWVDGTSYYSAKVDSGNSYEYQTAVDNNFVPAIQLLDDTWYHLTTYLHGNATGDADVRLDYSTIHNGGLKTDDNGYVRCRFTVAFANVGRFYIDEFFVRRAKWTGFPEAPPAMTWGDEEESIQALFTWQLRIMFLFMGLACVFVPIALIAGRYIKGGNILGACVVLVVGFALLMASGSPM